jgi:anti-sigma factor RsiW
MSIHLGDKLIDYAWGMLTPQEQASLDLHLRECAECRQELTEHQSLVGKLSATIPAKLPSAPASVRAGWPAVAARLPNLRTPAARRHGLPGAIAAGLAMSTAVVVLVMTIAQAWLATPPLTATAVSVTNSATPIASATYTPERPTAAATPVVSLYPLPMHAPQPDIVTTAKP